MGLRETTLSRLPAVVQIRYRQNVRYIMCVCVCVRVRVCACSKMLLNTVICMANSKESLYHLWFRGSWLWINDITKSVK